MYHTSSLFGPLLSILVPLVISYFPQALSITSIETAMKAVNSNLIFHILGYISTFLNLLLEFYQEARALIHLSTPTQKWFLLFIHNTNIFLSRDPESDNNTDIEHLKSVTYYLIFFTCKMHIQIGFLIIPILHASNEEAMQLVCGFSAVIYASRI